MKKDFNWKYSFFKENPWVSASVILVLILCLYVSSYWITGKVLFFFSLFIVSYFREVFFPLNYSAHMRDRKIIVRGFLISKEIDVSRFYVLKKWKNGVFLSTMENERVRGEKLFVRNSEKDEIFNRINGIINGNK